MVKISSKKNPLGQFQEDSKGDLVGMTGLEPATSRPPDVHSTT